MTPIPHICRHLLTLCLLTSLVSAADQATGTDDHSIDFQGLLNTTTAPAFMIHPAYLQIATWMPERPKGPRTSIGQGQLVSYYAESIPALEEHLASIQSARTHLHHLCAGADENLDHMLDAFDQIVDNKKLMLDSSIAGLWRVQIFPVGPVDTVDVDGILAIGQRLGNRLETMDQRTADRIREDLHIYQQALSGERREAVVATIKLRGQIEHFDKEENALLDDEAAFLAWKQDFVDLAMAARPFVAVHDTRLMRKIQKIEVLDWQEEHAERATKTFAQPIQTVFKSLFDRNRGGFRIPNPWHACDRPTPSTADPTEGFLMTAAMLEWQAATAALDPALFELPEDHPDHTPLHAPRTDAAAILDRPDPAWAQAFAMDWSAPVTSPMIRPIMATRYHKAGRVAVIFADSHYELVRIEPQESPAQQCTIGTDGEPVSFAAFTRANDPFSHADDEDPDGSIMATYGNPDARRERVWMR